MEYYNLLLNDIRLDVILIYIVDMQPRKAVLWPNLLIVTWYH